MLKAVIVDDESKAIQSLLWELKHFKNEVKIVKTFTDPEEALLFLNKSNHLGVSLNEFFIDPENTLSAIVVASFPEMRMMAIPPSPGGVAMAAIVEF